MLMFAVFSAVLPAAPALKDVHTIYVDSLGDSDGSRLIREKIINRLAGKFAVTDRKEDADAILCGAAMVGVTGSIETRPGYAAANADPQASVAVRLVSRRGDILWVHEARNSSWVWKSSSVSTQVAESVVKALVKRYERALKAKAPSDTQD